jgi:hypothetical protein
MREMPRCLLFAGMVCFAGGCNDQSLARSSGDGGGGATDVGSPPLDALPADAAVAAVDSALPLDLIPAPCPDVLGTYSMIQTDGLGCGDLNTSAPQCIAGTIGLCSLHFKSVVQGGGTGAVNGGATLNMDGTFSGATIFFGSNMRTGCTGSWNSATQTMEVDCGGPRGSGTTQQCSVTMVRTSITPCM